MKKIKSIIVGLITLILMLIMQHSIQAQQGEEVLYPNNWYVKQERLSPDDWVVEFQLPNDAQIRRVFCVGNSKEQGLFDKSDVSYPSKNGKKLVVITIGGIGRNQTGYTGSLDSWAKSLRVRYARPFQPRGPRINPRGPR